MNNEEQREEFDEDLFRQSSWYKAEKAMIQAEERQRIVEIIDKRLKNITQMHSYDVTSRITDLVDLKQDITILQELDKQTNV